MAPIREMAPLTTRAAEGIETFESSTGPTSGFAERVYACDLLAGCAGGRTLALLTGASWERRLVLRFNHNELPWLVVWKNAGALEDGYVAGLEPATNLPNFKGFERRQRRVIMVPPGGRWHCQCSLEAIDNRSSVNTVLQEIVTLSSCTAPRYIVPLRPNSVPWNKCHLVIFEQYPFGWQPGDTNSIDDRGRGSHHLNADSLTKNCWVRWSAIRGECVVGSPSQSQWESVTSLH